MPCNPLQHSPHSAPAVVLLHECIVQLVAVAARSQHATYLDEEPDPSITREDSAAVGLMAVLSTPSSSSHGTIVVHLIAVDD